MMRHHAKIASGLALVAVIPGLGLQQDGVRALESALLGIESSLDALRGLGERIPEEPEAAKALLLRATEHSHLEERALDERLGQLRRQVSLLQMEHDALLAAEQEAPGGGAAAGTTTPVPPTPEKPLAFSTGLNESLRTSMKARLRSPGEARASPPDPGAFASGEPRRPQGTAPEPAEPVGYSADPLGQAKASFYAGRFEDALRLLEGREDTASRYLLSRCLTRLERYDEALTILTAIVEEAGDSYEGRRAATDIEFVRWKKDFSKRLPGGMRKDAPR